MTGKISRNYLLFLKIFTIQSFSTIIARKSYFQSSINCFVTYENRSHQAKTYLGIHHFSIRTPVAAIHILSCFSEGFEGLNLVWDVVVGMGP